MGVGPVNKYFIFLTVQQARMMLSNLVPMAMLLRACPPYKIKLLSHFTALKRLNT
jgi:hypothetical protein